MLPTTNLSSVGQPLADKLSQEWDEFDSMTKEQQCTSSKLWGIVDIQTDTWDDCEEAIGFTLYNPLETLDWLSKTGYFGMEHVDSQTPTAVSYTHLARGAVIIHPEEFCRYAEEFLTGKTEGEEDK